MKKRICVSLLTLSFLVLAAAVAPAYAGPVDGMKGRVLYAVHVVGRLLKTGEYPKEIRNARGHAPEMEAVTTDAR
ncbi:MAG TPA: hypothetical protein VD861_20300 [Pyrinomonadaceae bacterium]|nr:hypothetical protein [Pyrinomonadaceae bacterium]